MLGEESRGPRIPEERVCGQASSCEPVGQLSQAPGLGPPSIHLLRHDHVTVPHFTRYPLERFTSSQGARAKGMAERFGTQLPPELGGVDQVEPLGTDGPLRDTPSEFRCHATAITIRAYLARFSGASAGKEPEGARPGGDVVPEDVFEGRIHGDVALPAMFGWSQDAHPLRAPYPNAWRMPFRRMLVIEFQIAQLQRARLAEPKAGQSHKGEQDRRPQQDATGCEVQQGHQFLLGHRLAILQGARGAPCTAAAVGRELGSRIHGNPVERDRPSQHSLEKAPFLAHGSLGQPLFGFLLWRVTLCHDGSSVVS